ncbi:MAG: hypothetical protein ACI31F_06630 [Muribaculaceae bacterium]
MKCIEFWWGFLKKMKSSGHHQCVGDTLMMGSLGEAPIVVNAGFSLGEA